LFEVFTWLQLGLHDKPIGLLNVNGFYDGLIQFLSHQVAEGFLKANQAGFLMHEAEPSALLARFQSYVPKLYDKFLDQQTANDILP